MNKQIVQRRKFFSYVSIFILCVCSVFAAVFRCARLIERNYLEQLEQNLEDVALQTSEFLQEQIKVRYELLKSVAMRFELEPDVRKQNLYMFEPVSEAFHLVRIGYCDENGIPYATSGKTTSLKAREFFQRGMKGETYISDVLHDAMDDKHEHVTIMSMPIHDSNNKINGVAGITYRTEFLNEEIATKIFDGYGTTVVINEKGTVNISSNENIVKIHDNLFNILSDEIAENQDSRSQLIKEIISRPEEKIIYDTIQLNGKKCYYHVTPVSLLDNSLVWYVLSFVPEDYLTARFKPTKINLYRMLMFVMIFGISSIILVQVISFRQKSYTHRVAFTSPLTGGANLNQLYNILHKNDVSKGFIVFMNIENFSNTAVAVGKGRSCKLLKNIWKILELEERSDDLFCHNQKDTFVLYFGSESAVNLEDRLNLMHGLIHDEAIVEHISWINARFGICNILNADSLEDACHKAEVAVNDVHGDMKCFSYYDDDKQKLQIENQKLEDYFDEALKNEEFKIYFQPKYSVQKSELSGCEALVRWNYKGNKMISPGEFIPMLERSGKIVKLDEYIFRKVCEYQKMWKEQGLKIVPVSVNVSKATLFLDDIDAHYLSMMESHGLSSSEIQLEVTETLVGASNKMAVLLNRFRNYGIKILMDDFGTGYTSLSTLNLQCFDTLKMDKSLIDGIETECGQKLLLGAIDVAKRLGYYITAEGVETESQLLFLKSSAVDDIQGFLFARPLPAEEFERKIQKKAA